MTRSDPLILVATAVLFAAVTAHADDVKRRPNTAAKPGKPRDPDWLKAHETFVVMARKGGIDLLLLGDSITAQWGGEGHDHPDCNGLKFFKELFEPLRAANFGIGGDYTQWLLWRLQNGELDGIHPKAVMLLIGSNNLISHEADEIAEGVEVIIKEIQKKSPKTKVLLLGIFPRASYLDPEIVKMSWQKRKRVNTILAKLDDGGKTVKYMDIGEKFLEPDGTLSRAIMYDLVHLTPKGYEIWASAVKGPIRELMGQD